MRRVYNRGLACAPQALMPQTVEEIGEKTVCFVVVYEMRSAA